MNWSNLETAAQLDSIIEESLSQPVAIFKHSTRCGVSGTVMRQLEREWSFNDNEVKAYYLDLLGYRSISNEIAEKLDVDHQSPQLIVVLNKEVVYHASHADISVSAIQQIFKTA